MRLPRAWLRAAGLAAVGATAVACATSGTAGGAAGGAASPPASASSASSASSAAGSHAPPTPSPQVTQAAGLSPAQLAGQRVIFSYAGQRPPAALLSLIAHGEVAGVIFFSGNVASAAQLSGVIRQLDAAEADPTNPVRAPLLLMTDQEGGPVRRLPGAPFLSEKQVGQSANPAAAARTAGTQAAANLRGIGLNVNLAPVLDVFRTAGDFDDQFGRSYSSDPRAVASLGADFIAAQQAGGVAATAKHFPGLGSAATKQDTDFEPVTLNVPAATLRAVDELPYPAAISAGVKLVMVSWAVYPALDPSRPAGMSARIVQGELRGRLGFGGVTITDALEAGALKSYGSIAHRALLAAQAGMDLILCSAQSTTEGTECLSGLEGGYGSGALPRAGFEAAAARVMALRASPVLRTWGFTG
ncbi:MAG TPA: glycoside hydrolase family 3 N-terminal domain-containing protein, partial [Streptosporangiaceae bacterium]|nr:glycoside hydrolase family 3 N-terminal domain-containing protein [Streptosporangiaceae bacterium]